MNAAQAAKTEVEEHQRHLRAERERKGEPAPEPRFFKPVGEKWFPKLDIDKWVEKFIDLTTAFPRTQASLMLKCASSSSEIVSLALLQRRHEARRRRRLLHNPRWRSHR